MRVRVKTAKTAWIINSTESNIHSLINDAHRSHWVFFAVVFTVTVVFSSSNLFCLQIHTNVALVWVLDASFLKGFNPEQSFHIVRFWLHPQPFHSSFLATNILSLKCTQAEVWTKKSSPQILFFLSTQVWTFWSTYLEVCTLKCVFQLDAILDKMVGASLHSWHVLDSLHT